MVPSAGRVRGQCVLTGREDLVDLDSEEARATARQEYEARTAKRGGFFLGSVNKDILSGDIDS